MLALTPAAVALAVAGCGGTTSSNSKQSSAAPASARAAGSTVSVATTGLGQVLVDSRGRTLYLFEKDRGTASTCYGDCATAWPPLVVSGVPTAGAGILASKLGTTKRTGGPTEVTYNGHPLYYYIADTAPGQTSGQGLNQFGAGWDALTPGGNKIESGN
jgi:predicted lipoprotein with Yx(FWY)xxD motif